jgi:hypothetical protein
LEGVGKWEGEREREREWERGKGRGTGGVARVGGGMGSGEGVGAVHPSMLRRYDTGGVLDTADAPKLSNNSAKI